MGALDVCPFVPVSNVSMEECVQLSRQFGEKVCRWIVYAQLCSYPHPSPPPSHLPLPHMQLASELGVPVYLYEASQEKEYRKSLSQIRAGEYEGLPEKVCIHPPHANPTYWTPL